MQPIIGLIPVVKPVDYAENVPGLVSTTQEILTKKGCKVLFTQPLLREDEAVRAAGDLIRQGVHLLVFFVGSWILAPQIISAVNYITTPFVLWGLSTAPNFAMGGSIQAKYVLEEMGIKFKYVAGVPTDADVISDIVVRARAAAVMMRLRRARIGKIGGMSMMMYQTSMDEIFWKKITGINMPHLDTYQIVKRIDTISDKDAKKVLEKVRGIIGNIKRRIKETGETLTDDDLLVQCKIYLAMKILVKENSLDALGNKCLPELASSEYGCGVSACLAHALLNDEGIMCACEADMPACLTMYILHLFTGQIVYFGDIAALDKKQNVAIFFNCGSAPFSLAESKDKITLWPVPQFMASVAVTSTWQGGTSRGATTGFHLRKGDVTLARIGGGKGTARMHIAKGKIIEPEVEKESVGVEVRWPRATVKFDGILMDFLRKATGHHYSIVYGDCTGELVELCDLLGIDAIIS